MKLRLSIVIVIALGGLLWWQTRATSSAERHAAADRGTAGFDRALDPPGLADDPTPEVDDEHSWRPGDHDPADWEPGETPIGWDRWLTDFARPRPGEGLLEYRDRIVPAAQLAIAPQRQAVRRRYEGSMASAGIDAETRAELDAILERGQQQLKERIGGAVFGGELFGPRARPIDGVRFARDLLDVVLATDAAVASALTPAQRRAFADSGFDVALYLLVATRWEQLIGVE